MPQSKRRQKHHRHHPAQPHKVKSTPRLGSKNPVTIMVVFVGILGALMALLATGADPVWLITGALAGAVVGYFIGKRMSRLG